MVDNIYLLPETYGPALREFYSKLLQEPLPRQLRDLIAMLEEASAQVDAPARPDADVRDPAIPAIARQSDTCG